MGGWAFATLTARAVPVGGFKSQQLLAEFHDLIPQFVLNLGLLAELTFHSNQREVSTNLHDLS